MIFDYIHIQNFKSIQDMRLEYKAGVWEVIGQNNSADYLSNGSGKALANDEPVLTTKGWKPICEITTKDMVIGSDGQGHRVIGVYPQGERQLYRVQFRDGTHTDCDGDHLWTVNAGKCTSEVTLTTIDLLQDPKVYSVDLPEACETYENTLTGSSIVARQNYITQLLTKGIVVLNRDVVHQYVDIARSLGLYIEVTQGADEYLVHRSNKCIKAIIAITKINKGNATCISIDAEDKLYVTRGFTLTHNTTTLEAIQQCLFNRTTLTVPIEDTGRKSEGSSTSNREYILTTEFTKDNKHYKVINDRNAMKITIIEDGEDLGIRSIPIALKKIQTIMGMDLTTFITLTFITHTTISDLLDNFSSSSLMKIILDFDQITALNTKLKAEVKVSNDKILQMTSSIKTIKDSLEVLSKYKEIDTSAMYAKKGKLSTIRDAARSKIAATTSAIDDRTTLQRKLKGLQAKDKALSNGICECCGSILLSSQEEVAEVVVELAATRDALAKLGDTLDKDLQVANIVLKETNTDLSNISQTILAAETKNQIYSENVNHAETLREQKAALLSDRDTEYFRLDVLTSAAKLIKEGGLHKHLLLSFVKVLNSYLSQFKEFVNLPYISIVAESSKTNVGFVLYDTRFSQRIHLNTLSGGEKTRLRLILLLSMLNTIKDLTNASTNLLVFDESLDTLDESASPDLARLFDYLVNHNDKFIALISHGKQLKDINFTGRLTITKDNGISTLEVDKYD